MDSGRCGISRRSATTPVATSSGGACLVRSTGIASPPRTRRRDVRECWQVPAGQGPSYTYTPDGKLAAHTWARGIVTAYT